LHSAPLKKTSPSSTCNLWKDTTDTIWTRWKI